MAPSCMVSLGFRSIVDGHWYLGISRVEGTVSFRQVDHGDLQCLAKLLEVFWHSQRARSATCRSEEAEGEVPSICYSPGTEKI